MRFRIPFLRFLALPALLGALFLAACHLGGEEKVEATISFNQIFDSLKQYDHVVISLKDAGGNTIDVVFEGQVKIPGGVEKLAAPHWDGGPITVSIVGYKEGKIVYNTETGFDGKTNKKDSTYVFVDPIMGLAYTGGAIPMLEGDSINLPTITITPANLKIKTLKWVSSAPDVIRVGITGFKALKAGNAQITVSLDADPTKSIVISVTVVDPAKIPESLALSNDTLKLSAGGAPGRLELQFIPTTSAKDVVWSILDTSVASVAADGTVHGRKAGETHLFVTSSLKASATDTAVVIVTQPKPPEKVVFAKAETEIFVGGAAESLLVSILPPEANQEVEFSVTTPLLIELKNGRISGLAAGDGLVIAKSKADGSLLDTLKVKITVKQVVTSLTIAKKSLTIFTGGDEPVLTAAIEPATSNQKVQWRSDRSDIAKVSDAGKVTGVAPGHATLHAISLVDSTKQDSAVITVKTDAPVVNIGRPDTTVSVGSSVTFLPVVPVQEFGVVVAFRWDVDGIAGWDDTAKVVQGVTFKFDQEKEYILRFYVRDSEGNETIATKKVSAVVGPVVTIVEPADGAYFTTQSIKIIWKIDNVLQTSGTDTVLKVGANTIRRTAMDAAGKVFSASVTVYLDTVPPAKPTVKGPAGLASGKPTWTWSPGGGGNGTYRISVDSQVFVGAGIKDTLYIPATALTEGVHTLYVQERDVAGNWSLPGKIITTVDLTGPNKPLVKLNVPSPSNVKRPVWTWSTGAGAGNSTFQFKFDNSDFTSGASIPAVDTQFTPTNDLGDGVHTLYVRERDSLGNWSDPGSASLTIDITPPTSPRFETTPPSEMAKAAGNWTWTTGSDAGSGLSGKFRFSLNGGGAWTETTTNGVTNLLLKEGVQSLSIQAEDNAHNWSTSTTDTVLVDTKGPIVSFAAPASGGSVYTDTSNNKIQIQISAKDSGTGVDNVECALTNSGSTVNVPLSPASGFWSATPTFAPGVTIVACHANDKLGTLGAAAQITVNIALPKPIIAVSDYLDGMVFSTNKPFTVHFTVTINGKESNDSQTVSLGTSPSTSNPIPVILTSTITNLAGEKGIKNVSYWFRPAAVFVNHGAKGKNDGSSWLDAYLKFDAAANDPRFQSGNANLWISKGTYGDLVTKIDLPRKGGLIGGFDAITLPKDTTFPSRNPSINRSILASFDFNHTSLDQFGFHGLEFENSSYRNQPSTLDATGNLQISNCAFRAVTKNGEARHSEWFFVADINVSMESTSVNVGNADLGWDWSIRIDSHYGEFNFLNCRFTRSYPTSNTIIGASYLYNQPGDLRINIVGTELNYSLTEGYYQVWAGNNNSTTTIEKSSVKGGKSGIYSAGILNYTNNSTLP